MYDPVSVIESRNSHGEAGVSNVKKNIGRPKSVMEAKWKQVIGFKSRSYHTIRKAFSCKHYKIKPSANGNMGSTAQSQFFKVWMNGLEQNGKPILIANT